MVKLIRKQARKVYEANARIPKRKEVPVAIGRQERKEGDEIKEIYNRLKEIKKVKPLIAKIQSQLEKETIKLDEARESKENDVKKVSEVPSELELLSRRRLSELSDGEIKNILNGNDGLIKDLMKSCILAAEKEKVLNERISKLSYRNTDLIKEVENAIKETSKT